MKTQKFRDNFRKVFGVILIILLVLTIVVTSFISEKYNPAEVYGLEIITKENSGVSISFDLKEKFEKDFPKMKMSIYNKEQLPTSTMYSDTNAMVYGGDGDFFTANKYPVIKGSYLFERDIEARNRFVVISRDLSYELFNTVDVIGKDIEVNNKEFSIIGVIESSKLLPGNAFYKEEHLLVMSSKNFESITNKNGGINTTILSSEGVDQVLIESWLQDNGLRIWQYEINYKGYGNLLFRKNLALVNFVLGMTLIWFGILKLYDYLTTTVQTIIKWNRDMYPKEWLRLKQKDLGFRTLKILVIIGSMAAIWRWITFDFYFDLYYDGTKSISNFREFVLWFIETQKYTLKEHRTSMSWTIDILDRARNYTLVVLMVLVYPMLLKRLTQLYVRFGIHKE